MLGQVDSFGERMADTPDSTRLGKAVGLGLVNLANSELAKLYTRAGETAEAQRAESRIQQVKDRQAGLWDLAGFYRSRTFRRAGFLVPGFGILAVLTGFFALASVLLLELSPARLVRRKTMWRRFLCCAADYAPAAALVSSGALLLSFLPIARAFSEYRAASSALDGHDIFTEALWEFGFITQNYGWPERSLWLWCLIIITLAGLAMFIVVRSIYQARFRPVTT